MMNLLCMALLELGKGGEKVQIGKIDNMIDMENAPKLASKNSPGNDETFSKEFDKALKEKAADRSKEKSTDEKAGESNKLDNKEPILKDTKVQGEKKKENVNIKDGDCSGDKKAVESSLELILSMLKGTEPLNLGKLQEALKAIENSGEIITKSVSNLNGNVQNAVGNINSKIKEILAMLEKDNGKVALKDFTQIAKMMKAVEQPMMGAGKIVDSITDNTVRSTNDNTDAMVSLKEKIKQTLLSKMNKEEDQVPVPSNIKVNESDSKILTSKEASKEKSSLDANNLQKAKEEKLLSGLLSQNKETDKKDSLINKVTNFTAQFNSIKENTISVEEPKMVITKNNVVQDIVKTVKFMQVNDLKELTVKIAPKELGEVIIKLTMDNGVMKANITATNKEAYNLLNNNMSDINGKLNNTEIKVQDFNLNLYNGDTTFFKDQNKRHDEWQQDKKSGISRQAIDEEEAIDSIEEDNSNVNIYA